MRIAFSLSIFIALQGTLGFTCGPQKSSRNFTHMNVKVDGKTVENEVKPINNMVLVKKAESLQQTQGGIILTGKAKDTKFEGTVVSVGQGRVHPETGAIYDMPVESGDGVVYGQYDGTDITIDGVKHTMIQDTDILVKYKGDRLTIDSAEVVRDGVLVYIEPKDSSSDTGILIAQSSKSEKKPSNGKVVKVGPGRLATNGELMEMEVEVGDYVKFREFASTEVEIDGESYFVVRMADVLAKY